MVWKTLTDGLAEALRHEGLDPAVLERLELAIPRDPAHGDWTTNLALVLAKKIGRPPRALAEALARGFPQTQGIFAPPEVAGPGFLNFRYAAPFLTALPRSILEAGERFGAHDHAGGVTIQVEYVSANPTGPLNVVSARAAAVGAALVRLLNATGHRAAGEFYVNDAGHQVDLLGESVAARFAERIGVARPFPENGYQGSYIAAVAAALPEAEARRRLEQADAASWFRDRALEGMLASQQKDLAEYGAEFAVWFHESALHRSGEVDAALRALEARGMTYRAIEPEIDRSRDAAPAAAAAPGPREIATYVRTAQFGDDKDRVVVRSNGVPTYLLPDIAYHVDKRRRGFRHAIDLWGPDHHGHILPLQAALGAVGMEPDFLEVLIVQQVNLLSGGAPVRMSKRAGEFVTLRDLMEDIGADCAKFLFLMRSTSAHLDFDLDLARRQNDENPAFYVQYAHARIASILRFAHDRGITPAAGAAVRLEAPEEIALVRRLAMFPEVVRGAAFAREPHRVPAYLMETAAEFHRFYHACRVVDEQDRERSASRITLAEATRIVIRNGLALLGVGAPERMERLEESRA